MLVFCVIAFFAFVILPHIEQQDADRLKRRLMRAEKFVEDQRRMLIQNPDDPPQFWRWK